MLTYNFCYLFHCEQYHFVDQTLSNSVLGDYVPFFFPSQYNTLWLLVFVYFVYCQVLFLITKLCVTDL